MMLDSVEDEKLANRVQNLKVNEDSEGSGTVPAPDDGVEEQEEIRLPKGPAAIGEVVKKRKKRNKKKAKTAPSGFEEFYTEPTLTKDEYEEEIHLYSMKRPFTERIEIAIQRYRAKRKFDPTRQQLFDQFLLLGGININQKSFGGGMDNTAMEEMDAEQIATHVAKDCVPDRIKQARMSEKGYKDNEDDEEEFWDVDFELVAKGFLSYKLPFILGCRDVGKFKEACLLLRNFYNYLIYHNVATEYDGNIRAAIKLTKIAESELAQCQYFARRVPGRFHTACSTIFGGFYQGLNDESKTSWMSEELKKSLPRAGFTDAEARAVLQANFEIHLPSEYASVGFNAKRVKTQDIGVEVLEVHEPPFDAPGKNLALGKIKVKVWSPRSENEWETDLDEFELYLEKEALQFAFEGMHFETTMHTLDTGMHYIDNITSCQTSFYTELEDPEFLKKAQDDSEFDDDEGKKSEDNREETSPPKADQSAI